MAYKERVMQISSYLGGGSSAVSSSININEWNKYEASSVFLFSPPTRVHHSPESLSKVAAF